MIDLSTGTWGRSRASTVLAGFLSRVATPARVAQARTGLGLTMIARPSLMPRGLGVPQAAADSTGWVVQMLGAREVALGLGTWAALRRPDHRAARLWVAAGLLSDAVDALAVARALGRGSVRPMAGSALVAVAVSTAAVEAAALGGKDLR